jgi:hypothetical protein
VRGARHHLPPPRPTDPSQEGRASLAPSKRKHTRTRALMMIVILMRAGARGAGRPSTAVVVRPQPREARPIRGVITPTVCILAYM